MSALIQTNKILSVVMLSNIQITNITTYAGIPFLSGLFQQQKDNYHQQKNPTEGIMKIVFLLEELIANAKHNDVDDKHAVKPE